MMKNYHLYVFTQDGCPPCAKLKNHVATLPEEQRAEIDFVPLKIDGQRSALATELSVDLTPTLVVVHEHVECQLDRDGDEDCDYVEESVERFIGATSIIEHLPATIDAYTYAVAE
jgi:thioredoxin-like negative regulator of GroEL